MPVASSPPELRHGAAPGLDARTKLRMRRGQIDVEAKLDLHGHDQLGAHRALEAFLAANRAAGRRAVLVITGKGKTGGGVLRDAVPRWLNEQPLRSWVHAFSHAHPKDGGEGALYVLLRRDRTGRG